MSTRKKVGIGDLLRDEAQKGTEIASVSSVQSNEQIIEVKAESVVESQTLSSANSNRDLELALIASQQRELELSQTITNLQKDLQFTTTNVELLQKSLKAIETLKEELEQQLVEVKRDNLRLAEANIQLSEQIKAMESESVQSPPVPNSQLVPQAQDYHNNRATPRKQPVEQPYARRDRINPYARPTGSNEQLQRVNNKTIGWMD